jgi:hypothetical protein
MKIVEGKIRSYIFFSQIQSPKKLLKSGINITSKKLKNNGFEHNLSRANMKLKINKKLKGYQMSTVMKLFWTLSYSHNFFQCEVIMNLYPFIYQMQK